MIIRIKLLEQSQETRGILYDVANALCFEHRFFAELLVEVTKIQERQKIEGEGVHYDTPAPVAWDFTYTAEEAADLMIELKATFHSAFKIAQNTEQHTLLEKSKRYSSLCDE